MVHVKLAVLPISRTQVGSKAYPPNMRYLNGKGTSYSWRSTLLGYAALAVMYLHAKRHGTEDQLLRGKFSECGVRAATLLQCLKEELPAAVENYRVYMRRELEGRTLYSRIYNMYWENNTGKPSVAGGTDNIQYSSEHPSRDPVLKHLVPLIWQRQVRAGFSKSALHSLDWEALALELEQLSGHLLHLRYRREPVAVAADCTGVGPGAAGL